MQEVKNLCKCISQYIDKKSFIKIVVKKNYSRRQQDNLHYHNHYHQSLYVMLSILLSILVCAAASLFCACLVSVQVSAPYVIAGSTQEL